MVSHARRLGTDGEAVVAAHYARCGYELLDRNWRRREGEVDLIVSRGDLVVFCEVKTRSGVAYGHGSEAVGPRKRQRLRQLAARWLQERRDAGERTGGISVRFDVASVDAGPHGYRVDLIEDAF